MAIEKSALRATTIAHADHLFLGPLSSAKADWLIGLLDLPDRARVLDIGCGKAAFLQRVLKRYASALCVGIDINDAFLETAAADAVNERISERLTLHRIAAAAYLEAPARFDAVLCLGASQALGGFDGLVAAARRVLTADGLLLLGEGYWRQSPAAEYLAVLDATEDEMTDHAGNAGRLQLAGFEVLTTAASSVDEWDVYEGLYCRAQLRWARAHPDDPFSRELLEKATRWYRAYHRWGRETLGFGWYLARPA